MGFAKYLWLDLETTGLEESRCTVLEVAAIITDEQLVEIDRWRRVVNHDLKTLMMAQWPWEQHSASGLLEEIKEAKAHMVHVDEALDRWVAGHDGQGATPLHLAGSSIHFDRGFMKMHLPRTLKALHYRQFDVSSLLVVAGDWWPDLQLPEHNKAHRAAADIENSLELARFFKERLKAVP